MTDLRLPESCKIVSVYGGHGPALVEPCEDYYTADDMREHAAAMTAVLRDALAHALEDAERYRWLRDTGAVFTVRVTGEEGRSCEVMAIGRPAEGLDAAIDAERTNP